MTTTLHAQSYDLAAKGFYFRCAEEFDAQVSKLTNVFGQPVEEFEIQLTHGKQIDWELAKAITLSQGNFRDYLSCIEAWEDWQKIRVIIAVGECGYEYDADFDPDCHGIDVHYASSMRELAEQFVEDGLYGDIPDHLQAYIDYEAIARHLAVDYSEIVIRGETLIYRAS